MFRQGVTDNLKELRRNDTRLGTSRPGPMSWGPGDGHARFYAADGSTVLFEAVGGSGAAVVSRGALTGLTGLIDGIRDLDDDQNGRLDGHNDRLDGHDADVSRIDSRNDAQDATLSSHNTRISNAQSRADDAHGDAATAQSRADSAWTRAGTGIANAATAQARADSAHTRIDGLNYASPNDLAALEGRIASVESHIGVIDSWLRQHTGYPSGGLNPNS